MLAHSGIWGEGLTCSPWAAFGKAGRFHERRTSSGLLNGVHRRPGQAALTAKPQPSTPVNARCDGERASENLFAVAEPGPFGDRLATTPSLLHRVPGPSATP
jgi:hypothetical protein